MEDGTILLMKLWVCGNIIYIDYANTRGDFMILMCKNTPVYDIEQEKVLNQALLPGYMREKGACSHTFTQWMKYRYSSGTNTMARRLKGITFGQGARMKINWETRALSFSDAYWLKDIDDSIRFEDISPYYKPFWDGSDEFSGQAAPTLYGRWSTFTKKRST